MALDRAGLAPEQIDIVSTHATGTGQGDAQECQALRKVFESSSCVACHKAGGLGRAMGPDLSRIGQIRQPRDVLESILFPNATIVTPGISESRR